MIGTLTRPRRVAVATAALTLALSGAAVLGASAASASDASMFAQVNASRAAAGLPSYAWDAHLADVALGQAERMAAKDLLYHNPNLASDVGDFRWAGENVGYGPTTDAIETAFMHSPMHRANILDSDYTQIGIGSVVDSHGRVWVAQVFREPLGGGSAPTVHPAHRSTAGGHATTVRSRRASSHARPTGAASGHAAHAATPHRPRAADHRPATRPDPTPTLAELVSTAQARHPGTGADPLQSTLAFAATMDAVGG